jgi:TrmH family RNA methyltransferase
MGSAFRLPVHRGGLAESLSELKTQGFSVIGANLNQNAESLHGFAFPGKCAVVIGGEGAGLSPQVQDLCDAQVYIPIKNAESLNAAVAASVIIYALTNS